MVSTVPICSMRVPPRSHGSLLYVGMSGNRFLMCGLCVDDASGHVFDPITRPYGELTKVRPSTRSLRSLAQDEEELLWQKENHSSRASERCERVEGRTESIQADQTL